MQKRILKIILYIIEKIEFYSIQFGLGVIFHKQVFKEGLDALYLNIKEDYDTWLEEEIEGLRITYQVWLDTKEFFGDVWLFFKPVIMPIYGLIGFLIRFVGFVNLVMGDNICEWLRGLSLYGRAVLSSVLITCSVCTYTWGIMGGEPIYKKKYWKWNHGQMFSPGGKLYYPKLHKPFHEMADPITRGGLRMILERIEQNPEFSYLLNKFTKRRGHDKETGERCIEILKDEVDYGDNLADWRKATLHDWVVELQSQIDAAQRFEEKSQKMQDKVERFLNEGSEYAKYIHFWYDNKPIVQFRAKCEAAIKILLTIKEKGVEALPRNLQEQVGNYVGQIWRVDHGREAIAKNQTYHRGHGYYLHPEYSTWRVASKEALEANSTVGVQGQAHKPFIFPYPDMVYNKHIKHLDVVFRPDLSFDMELSHRWGTRRVSLIDPMLWSHPVFIERQTHFTPRFSYELFQHLNKAKLYHRKYPAPHARHFTSMQEDFISVDATATDWILSFFNYIPDFYLIGIFSICSLVLTMALFLISIVGVPQNRDDEKISSYECGFQPFEDTRQKFDVKYYLVGILFIVFDIEIVLFMPGLLVINIVGVIVMSVFILIIIISFIYEWVKGALQGN